MKGSHGEAPEVKDKSQLCRMKMNGAALLSCIVGKEVLCGRTGLALPCCAGLMPEALEVIRHQDPTRQTEVKNGKTLAEDHGEGDAGGDHTARGSAKACHPHEWEIASAHREGNNLDSLFMCRLLEKGYSLVPS